MNNRPQLMAIKRDMLGGNNEVRFRPTTYRRADPKAAQHRNAQSEGQVAALIEAQQILVLVIAGDGAGRPFDEPVIADDCGMRELRPEMDRQLA